MNVAIGTFLIIAGLFAAYIFIDAGLGKAKYSSEVTEPRVIPAALETDRAIVMLVGFQNSGEAVAATLGPELARSGHVIVVEYPEVWAWNPDETIDELYRVVIETMRKHRLREPSFYGGSMGGIVAAEMLLRYQRDGMEREFGRVPLLNIDNAAGSPRSIKMLPVWFREMPGHTIGALGPITTIIKKFFVVRQVRPALAEVPEGVDPGPVVRHHETMGEAPMPQVAGELRLMSEVDITRPGASLARIVDRAIYSSGPDLDGDGLVNNKLALTEWQAAFPPLETRLNLPRGSGAHNTVAENPRPTGDLFAEVLGAA